VPKSTSESQAQITYLLTAPEPARGSATVNVMLYCTWRPSGFDRWTTWAGQWQHEHKHL